MIVSSGCEPGSPPKISGVMSMVTRPLSRACHLKKISCEMLEAVGVRPKRYIAARFGFELVPDSVQSRIRILEIHRVGRVARQPQMDLDGVIHLIVLLPLLLVSTGR